MLLKLLEPGRYDDYQQFATICKLRAGYHNVYMSSPLGALSLVTVGGDKGKHFLNTCPTHSSWFESFALGCLRRMGQEVRQDQALALPVLHDRLHTLQQHHPELIPPDVQVYKEYGLSQSFHRSSTSEARSRVKENDINLANCWRTFDNAQGRRPRLNMADHYSDICLLLPALLHYSSTL